MMLLDFTLVFMLIQKAFLMVWQVFIQDSAFLPDS